MPDAVSHGHLSFGMRILIAVTVVLAACGGGGDGGDGSRGAFVGTVVPPFPPDLAPAGMQAFPDDAPARHALDLVYGTDRQMLWLTRLRASNGIAQARDVIAVLDIPRNEENVSLVYTPGACHVRGEADPEVVALARVTFTPVLDEIVLAWRADRAAGRFDDVPASDVTCRNPRYPGAGGNAP